MKFNSILIGTDNQERLADFYTRLFGEPTWNDGGYTAWTIGEGMVTVGQHSEVHGSNEQPGRLIWNLESGDVRADFARFKEAGATVVREPYAFGDDQNKADVATLADPDGNYFQLISPMESEAAP
ncbi:MAG TPA: VOC family protein [Candidatus Limnocylindria bacterium]|jgi:predicted enzyme related to lactoylglutathione lyase|nr:VOC family protein [Candidatus Limnocylindria bacterium]